MSKVFTNMLKPYTGFSVGVTGSLVVSGSGPNGPKKAALYVIGDISASGKLTANEYHTLHTSRSIIFESGSSIMGDSIDDKHRFSGSIHLSGSLDSQGDLITQGDITASGDLFISDITASGGITASNVEVSQNFAIRAGAAGQESSSYFRYNSWLVRHHTGDLITNRNSNFEIRAGDRVEWGDPAGIRSTGPFYILTNYDAQNTGSKGFIVAKRSVSPNGIINSKIGLNLELPHNLTQVNRLHVNAHITASTPWISGDTVHISASGHVTSSGLYADGDITSLVTGSFPSIISGVPGQGHSTINQEEIIVYSADENERAIKLEGVSEKGILHIYGGGESTIGHIFDPYNDNYILGVSNSTQRNNYGLGIGVKSLVSFDERLRVAGNIFASASVSQSGHITASGNFKLDGGSIMTSGNGTASFGYVEATDISSSQDVYAKTYFIDNKKVLSHNGDNSILYIGPTGGGGASTFQFLNVKNTFNGHIEALGNITASGNISASGHVTASGFYTDGDITLSATGTITAAEGIFGTGTTTVNDNINTSGHITASGNISGSVVGKKHSVSFPSASFHRLDVHHTASIGYIQGYASDADKTFIALETDSVTIGIEDGGGTSGEIKIEDNKAVINSSQDDFDFVIHGNGQADKVVYDVGDKEFKLKDDGTKFRVGGGATFTGATGFGVFNGHVTASGRFSSSIGHREIGITAHTASIDKVEAQYFSSSIGHRKIGVSAHTASINYLISSHGDDVGATIGLTGGRIIFNARNADEDIFFKHDNGTAMFIEGAAGRIGIGTTSPATGLHVNTETRFTHCITGSGGTVGELYLSGSAGVVARDYITETQTIAAAGSGLGDYTGIGTTDGSVVFVTGADGTKGIKLPIIAAIPTKTNRIGRRIEVYNLTTDQNLKIHPGGTKQRIIGLAVNTDMTLAGGGSCVFTVLSGSTYVGRETGAPS